MHLKLHKQHPARIGLRNAIESAVAGHENTSTLRPPDQELVRNLVQQREPSPDVDLLLRRNFTPACHRPYLLLALHRKRGEAVAAAPGLRSEERRVGKEC